jgi:hypothetical protein
LAKVKIKGISQIEKKYRETFKKVKSSKPMLNEVGQFTVTTIAQSARRRKPLNSQGVFKNIKESTKRRRKSDAKYNKTHPTFSPNRSNLTFSGQLIDALRFQIKGIANIVVDVAGSLRSPRRDKKGRPIDDDLQTNQAVDADLRSRGFFLFTQKGLDDNEKYKLRINNILKKYVRRAIKVNFGP